jgi:hypothetical protein
MINTWKKVGATTGLVIPCEAPDRPEQVYVWVDTDPAVTTVVSDDYGKVVRPVRIEGWVGYSIPTRMRLTRHQAKDLCRLLMEALIDD